MESMMRITVLLGCFLYAIALRRVPNDKAQLAVNVQWQEELEIFSEFMDLDSDEVMEIKANIMPEDHDIVDAIERTGDQKALETFEPSKRLISYWRQALKESDPVHSLSDRCKRFIRLRGGMQSTHWSNISECAEPPVVSKACGTAYEVPSYRLGDFFYLMDHRNKRWIKTVFPNSIGAKYIATKKHWQDFDALLDIVKSDAYDDFEKPDSDAVVLHVRGYDIFSMEQGGAKHAYVKPPSYYKQIASTAKQEGFKKAVIVTGDHLMTQMMAAGAADTAVETNKKAVKHRKKNMELVKDQMSEKLKSLQEIFTSEGLEVSIRNNMNADCDFVFMANSKAFVPSGGNFDALAKTVCQKNGGIVLTA
eukprot:gnl/MRDRNA2_/MRDRNA2_82117_c0_seq1.p1 gnl/MRDRNA2_/MRDRNA2_82117_c0~~gnl/MRDRNA2_/MRDRNA2_82117_c0_seq1.p1  ORF type:complete len:364 (+),score=83.64 gnl/MRDRNA2_/MRDRNA2_82117_c0_seq1:84-1175(+)